MLFGRGISGAASSVCWSGWQRCVGSAQDSIWPPCCSWGAPFAGPRPHSQGEWAGMLFGLASATCTRTIVLFVGRMALSRGRLVCALRRVTSSLGLDALQFGGHGLELVPPRRWQRRVLVTRWSSPLAVGGRPPSCPMCMPQWGGSPLSLPSLRQRRSCHAGLGALCASLACSPPVLFVQSMVFVFMLCHFGFLH